MKDELTKRQHQVLEFIKSNTYIRAPTYREIATAFGMHIKGAYDHVAAIVQKGKLKRDEKGRIVIV